MAACFDSLDTLFSSECQSIVTALIFLLTVLGTGLYYGIPWIWKHVVYKYNFHVQFIDHPPPDHTIHNYWFPYPIPVGQSKLCCVAQAMHRFHGVRFNFRFVTTGNADVPRSIVEILKVEECDCDPKILEHTGSDTVGGVDGLYKDNIPAMAAKEGRYFWVTVKATQPWSGYLSFRMQEASGFRSYGSHAVTITQMPGQESVTSTEYISLKVAATELYTEARGKQHPLARIAEELGGWSGGQTIPGSPEDILNYIATYIVFSKKVPLFGKRVPSNRVEQISWQDVRAGSITHGATRLEDIHNNATFFTDLAVRENDLNRLIAELQMEHGFHVG